MEEGGFFINKAVFCVLLELAWTAYLKAKTNIWIEQRFGPLSQMRNAREGR